MEGLEQIVQLVLDTQREPALSRCCFVDVCHAPVRDEWFLLGSQAGVCCEA